MSQQTTPPSASTADGIFPRSNKKRKGFLGLIRREPDRQSVVSSANSITSGAPQQKMPAPPSTKALVNADHGVIPERRRVAAPARMKHGGIEQRQSDAAPTGSNPAEKRPVKGIPTGQIDSIDAELYHRLVNEIGAPARRKKPINTGLADKMRKAGWSYRQIAKHFKVSPCTVRRRLREKGLLK